MKDLKLYFLRIRQLEEELTKSHPDGCVFIASIHNPDMGMPGGKVYMALPRLAAECIINRTHELATPEAIEAWKKHDVLVGRALQARQSQLARINNTPAVTAVTLQEATE